MNVTHQILVCANDVNTLGENTNRTNKKEDFLLQASGEVGLEADTEKTKNMAMSRYQNSVQNHILLIDNKFFEHVTKFNIWKQK
jgi:hypothetical protein